MILPVSNEGPFLRIAGAAAADEEKRADKDNYFP